MIAKEEMDQLAQALETEAAVLSPEERAKLEQALDDAADAIERMNARLDQTNGHMERVFRAIDLMDTLTDDTAKTFGSREAALAWLVRPHRRLGFRAPLDSLRDKDGIYKVRRLLKAGMN